MAAPELHRPQHPIRIVTASALFDGHDASINIMRRILMSQGCEVIHLGHNRSVQEVVDAALEVTGHPIPVTLGERRAGDPAQLVASSDRIRADLGWAPKHTDLVGIVRDAWETARR